MNNSTSFAMDMCIGTRHYLQQPLTAGTKILTKYDEIVISNEVVSVLELIDNNAPFKITDFFNVLQSRKLFSNTNEMQDFVNELLKYDLIEIIDNVW